MSVTDLQRPAGTVPSPDLDPEPWIGRPGELDGHRRFWNAPRAPGVDQLRLALPDACVDEIDRALAGRAPEATVSLADAPMPALDEFAAQVRDALERAPGAVLIDRFPAERYDDAGNRAIAALFAPRIAPLLGQDRFGTDLYEVADERPSGAARRSKTSLGQPFHTDGGWYDPPASVIGLYCVRGAARGGHSLVTSLLAALDTLRRDGRHEALALLQRPIPWHRQGEHEPGESPTASLPVFAVDGNAWVARWYRSYVLSGYEADGHEVPADMRAALELLENVLDTQPKVRFIAEAGQWQAINNISCVHARDAFEDDPDAAPRRLIRVWHRAPDARVG